MKQNKKLLLILMAAVLLLGTVCLVLSLAGGEEQTESTEGQTLTVVRATASEEITAFTLVGTETTSVFELTGDGWVYNSEPNFPLNEDFVNRALTTLSGIDAVTLVAEGAQDLSPYGLDEPQMQVCFTASGEEVTFLIGDYNSFTGYHYLCEKGGGDVFQIDADLVDLCSAQESEWITLDSLPDTYAAGDIDKVTLSGAAEQVYDAESGEFEALAAELSALSLTDYADAYLAEEDFAEYGMDTPTTVHIDYSAEKTTTKEDGSEVSATVAYEYEFTVGGTDDTYVYFTVEDSQILYRMKKTDLPTLCAALA